ncbi:YcaO-like family protein [Elizabethkingia argenteiflava]|uniref:YcaO-like family protein n=1 Tax=Elizabethkingia argenteiflava TaxID=2681556 RepID=UPI00293BD744|nr:YcaO-like family protein [Elizabethkingia argenteiflava]
MTGAGLGFSKKEAEISAFGEYIERYVSSFQINNGLIHGSFNDLRDTYACYSPKSLEYFNKNQYESDTFELKQWREDSIIHWSKSCNYFSGEQILLPYFMTHTENIITDGRFHINTSTGTACHISIKKAVQSGLLECIERDAFCKFWYLQRNNRYRKFSENFILNQYPQDRIIEQLFNNKKVKIITYDISEYAYCPTFVVFILFKRKGRLLQSCGSASRLHHQEALIKACVEAYQGIDYADQLTFELKEEIPIEKVNQRDFSMINSFRKHYALYCLYPELRNEVPILKDVFGFSHYSNDWKEAYEHHVSDFSNEELKSKRLDEIYYTILSDPNIIPAGYEVVKVTTPKLHLLTGNFNYPYLGLFSDKEDLFTQMPHFFP